MGLVPRMKERKISSCETCTARASMGVSFGTMHWRGRRIGGGVALWLRPPRRQKAKPALICHTCRSCSPCRGQAALAFHRSTSQVGSCHLPVGELQMTSICATLAGETAAQRGADPGRNRPSPAGPTHGGAMPTRIASGHRRGAKLAQAELRKKLSTVITPKGRALQ